MAVKIRLQCPSCAKKFFSATLHPECCPLCGYVGAQHDDNVISMPALRSAVSKSADQVYRDMERSSEQRVQAAADMAGVSASEMAGLKITNLRDNAHEGENSAVPVSNDVTRHMDAMAARGGQVGFVNGAEYAAGTAQGVVTLNGKITTGIAPRAGANTLARIQGNK